MKLIKRTYLEALIWLIPVLIFGSIFSFYMIKHIVYEEVDEHLTYEMERLLQYHTEHNDLPEFHKAGDIIANMKLETPIFKDTLILETADNEMIPYRELLFSIEHDGEDFTIVLRQLLPGNDDVLEGALLMMLGLFVLIVLFLFLMLNTISKKLWSPFYKTLDGLIQYKLTDSVPSFAKSNIDEFNTLNETVNDLLIKISNDYNRNKEFNENASHELQTYLSIIRLHSERLLSTSQNEEGRMNDVKMILNAASKLSMVQKSLLLLSKIGNLEYRNNIDVELSDVLTNSIATFQEAIDIREIDLQQDIEEYKLKIDIGLAELLLSNLIKNAVKHNIQGGYIYISLKDGVLLVENSGSNFTGNPNVLFERFAKGKTGNLGLGLAIVKQICDIYKFNISYNVIENKHAIKISF